MRFQIITPALGCFQQQDIILENQNWQELSHTGINISLISTLSLSLHVSPTLRLATRSIIHPHQVVNLPHYFTNRTKKNNDRRFTAHSGKCHKTHNNNPTSYCTLMTQRPEEALGRCGGAVEEARQIHARSAK
uniref:Uncharacterized protein n=1 Tax=Corethron hystrix TaxID=216773 RepID=A0A7S1B3S1_9STRA|mmetsp:Transcript_11797/g.25868  ORF Transcript_11797/g.25868 Transcript_11797/m.25868 type:complete len:133 (+) Transcript_11797:107-505(+)